MGFLTIQPFTKIDFEFLSVISLSLLFLWITFLRVHCLNMNISFFSDKLKAAKKETGLLLILFIAVVCILQGLGVINIDAFYLATRSFFILALWQSVAAFILSFIKGWPYVSLLVGLMTVSNWIFAWGTYVENWKIYDSSGAFKLIPIVINVFIILISAIIRRRK
jgi:hypothetical protein